MNARHPVVTLTAREVDQLRETVRELGFDNARRHFGNLHETTLLRAGFPLPISRLTAEVIRGRLDRI